MSIRIPTSPAEFFTRFFPEQFAQDRARYPQDDTGASAVFEVHGVGAWSIRIKNGGLEVTAGKAPDCALQISLAPHDFTAIFVERTQKEVAAGGALSDDSKDAFKPLFVNEKKRAIVQTISHTLAVEVDHEGEKRTLFITPGGGERTEPKTTIAVKLDDFLGMQSGRKNPTMLFMSGSLKIRGDMGYAMRMNALIS